MYETARSNFLRGMVGPQIWSAMDKNIFRIALCLLLSVVLMTAQTVPAEELVVREVEDDIQDITEGQEPVVRSLTIYEAMARAIKYNRENRLKKMQSALAMEQRDKSYFDFLPELTASAGYTGRDNESASSSESFFTGEESLEASISEDKDRQLSDITLTWSALDFGLAYVRSNQYSDRYFIAREVERKTVQNIISDVRKEWWNAISAQRLLNKVEPFVQRVEKALSSSQEIEKQRLDAPLKALTYQRSLIDMLRTLERLREKLNISKHRLTSLMGMSHGQDYVLVDSGDNPDITGLAWDVATMEQVALLSRPELMQARYQDRITRDDARIAILGLIPDINLNAGWNYDSNSYLVNNSWFEYGAQISWNLMELFKAPSALRTAEAEQAVVKERRLAVAMTVLMQIHFAKANYLQSERQFQVEDLALTVENRILQQITSASKTQSEGQQTLIREEMNQLLAEVRHDNAYADLQNSLGRLFVSLGINTVPQNIESMSIEELADFLSKNMNDLENYSLNDSESLHLYLPQDETESSNGEESLNIANTTTSGETPQNLPEPVETSEIIEQEPIAQHIESGDEQGTTDNTLAENIAPDTVEVTEAVELTEELSVSDSTEPTKPQQVAEVAPQAPIMAEDTSTAEPIKDEAAIEEQIVFKANSVDIMEAPDKKSRILARVSVKGSTFPLLSAEETGWFQVDCFNTVGWIVADYAEKTGE